MILCSAALIGYALLQLLGGGIPSGGASKEMRKAEYDSLLAAAEAAIPANPVGDPLGLGDENSDLSDAAVLSAGENGEHSVLGMLTFTQRGVTMPVGDVLEDPAVLPKLQDRSAMVIEGASESWQFSILDQIGMGEEVVFTDILGHKYYYETTNVQKLDKGQQGTEDLQLIHEQGLGGYFYIGYEFVRAE